MIALFEEGGFTVIGVPEVAPALLPKAGLLAGQTGPRDADDAARAGIIARALGAVDVGQGVCVAQGLCLAVEALPGTDAMLTSLADLPPGLRPDPRLGRGLYYKAAKPGQDLRIDLPTIGPRTLELVAKAGLGGIVIEAGKVICLDLDQMLRQAALLDLFLWSRPCPASS